MSSEHIYKYYQLAPLYQPQKFDIVGRFEGDHKFEKYCERIGAYYGSGEYSITADDIDSIVLDNDPILIVGAGDGSHKSASTVDERLRALFKMDSSHILVPPVICPELSVVGGYQSDKGPVTRLCDISDDESVNECPDIYVSDDNIEDAPIMHPDESANTADDSDDNDITKYLL